MFFTMIVYASAYRLPSRKGASVTVCETLRESDVLIVCPAERAVAIATSRKSARPIGRNALIFGCRTLEDGPRP
jgi:hypothetical protein